MYQKRGEVSYIENGGEVYQKMGGSVLQNGGKCTGKKAGNPCKYWTFPHFDTLQLLSYIVTKYHAGGGIGCPAAVR